MSDSLHSTPIANGDGSQTSLPSKLAIPSHQWRTAMVYTNTDMSIPMSRFNSAMELLLEKPNLNSTYLFRADILYDSSQSLQTLRGKEAEHYARNGICEPVESQDDTQSNDNWYYGNNGEEVIRMLPSSEYALVRTVIRRLIPRKPQLDRALEQSCHVLVSTDQARSKNIVIYLPHATSPDIPWYHPDIKALAYLYEQDSLSTTLSIHFLPFNSSNVDAIPERLHRTLLSLLQTLTRLLKNWSPNNQSDCEKELPQSTTESLAFKGAAPPIMTLTPAALKDRILPQHIVQNTYTRLKQVYANDLMNRWVEKTDPSKHVFEDLSIAAFLIELWGDMYTRRHVQFPGFVDIACGNGILVYVLRQEGFEGSGFDARRRRTWSILNSADEYLREQICIPRPFLDVMRENQDYDLIETTGDGFCDGIFQPGTFIISNHADELTPWTPILAYLSHPEQPLPYLAIPCCSHDLSGAKFRYPPEDRGKMVVGMNDNDQPRSGDLKSIRAAGDTSMYACLTRKVVSLSEELGCETELTLMRIPSTRNIGVVGNRRLNSHDQRSVATIEIGVGKLLGEGEKEINTASRIAKFYTLIARECERSGGILAAAEGWSKHASSLQEGKGRGKVNTGGPRPH